uniref:Uncharacterized protein n=1 Tax=Peronospora matthiolae TaxID=2874970 RepID=A0AAV1UAJ5_9STRA
MQTPHEHEANERVVYSGLETDSPRPQSAAESGRWLFFRAFSWSCAGRGDESRWRRSLRPSAVPSTALFSL